MLILDLIREGKARLVRLHAGGDLAIFEVKEYLHPSLLCWKKNLERLSFLMSVANRFPNFPGS